MKFLTLLASSSRAFKLYPAPIRKKIPILTGLPTRRLLSTTVSATNPPQPESTNTNGYVAFDLGPVNHPIYGVANNLRGALPFTLPAGTYRLSKILEPNFAVEFDQLVNKLVPECRDLASTEKIITLVKDVITLVACINPPKFDMTAPQIMNQIYWWLSGFGVDDLADFIDDDSKQHVNILESMDAKLFVQIWDAWHSSLPPEPAKQPGFDVTANAPYPFKSPKFDAVLRLIRYGHDVLNNSHPELMYEELHGHAIEYWHNSMCTGILLNDFRRSGESFKSRASQDNLRRWLNAMPAILENNAICHSIRIPDRIRKSIFFQLAMTNFADICTLQNGLLGLLKDIKTNSIEDSPVLTLVAKEKTHDLDSAFGELYQKILLSYKDFQLSSSLLLHVYGEEDENVERFVELLKYTVDGSLYAAARMERYGLRDKLTFYD